MPRKHSQSLRRKAVCVFRQVYGIPYLALAGVPLGQRLLFWRNPAKTSCEASRLTDSHYLKMYWEINVRLFRGVIFFKTSMNFDSFLFLIFLRLSVSGASRFFRNKVAKSCHFFLIQQLIFFSFKSVSTSENYIHVCNEMWSYWLWIFTLQLVL